MKSFPRRLTAAGLHRDRSDSVGRPTSNPQKLEPAALHIPLILTVILMAASPVGAQQAERPAEPASPSSLARQLAVARAALRDGDVLVDGNITETAWQAAPLISGFVTSEPLDGGEPTRQTAVRILFDEDAIYIAARMWDHPDSIQRQLVRRDERGPYMDWFGFAIDPSHDRRTGYHFKVNAAGVQQDIYISDDSREDSNWNAVWESAVASDSLGWTVEARLPLSQIRYEATDGPQTWGLNLFRRRVAAAEKSHFSLESRKIRGIASQFGDLVDVQVPSSIRRVEARPYILSSFHNGPATDGDPFFDGNAAGARVGSDFRLGLGSAFTLDATVNPDFGQVDADPAVINLTAFESFFPEQRPFFVEDAQVFDFRLSGRQNKLFYSRRIGRSPHGGAPSDADFSDVPAAATILGATKVTGRTKSGLSLGGLAAVTQAESGEAFFSDGNRLDRFRVEPRTEFGVVSVKQDFNSGMSQVGALFSMLRRAQAPDHDLDYLSDQTFNSGVRFDHQWSERTWKLAGFLAGSRVQGSPQAMIAIQRASNHYFQRPDGTRVQVDSAATSMAGAEWRVQLDRQNTEHWTGSVWTAGVTRGFEVNDLGFSRNRERLDGGFRAGYRELNPGRVLREYSFTFFTFYNFSWEAFDNPGSWSSWQRAYTNGRFSLGSQITLLNYNTANLNLSFQPDQYSRSATRGGPVMIQPGNLSGRFGVGTDRRQPTSFRANLNYSRASSNSGSRTSVEGSVTLRPSPRVQVSIDSEFSVQSDGSQYVRSTSTLPYTPTYGRRYLFGDLERKSLSLEVRANYTFTPKLSFQLFAQPLISSGKYLRYKQLAAPSTFSFRNFQDGTAANVDGSVLCAGGDICRDAQGTQHVDFDGDGAPDYAFADKDFNVRSVIGNAVLRWEYRPGSTVFIVWQRQQEHDNGFGNFDLGRDLDALWGAPAQNRFIIKLNYWLGL